MNQPKVAAIMLVDGRLDMAHRAIRSFIAQTYRPVKLIVYETVRGAHSPMVDVSTYGPFVGHCMLVNPPDTIRIGELRNRANDIAQDADILIHWDSDDCSHPMRIEEQVALLQSSGADVVGYSDMLFLREAGGDPRLTGGTCECTSTYVDPKCTAHPAQAWLYRNNDRRYCLGTSLCYWRKTWEAKPFNPKLPERRGGTGEDTEWLRGLNSTAVPSVRLMPHENPLHPERGLTWPEVPRMVASIHGSNTQDYRGIEKSTNSWTRVPQWDDYCRRVMQI